MVKVFVNTPHEFYMDGYLKENLETAKTVVKKDWDMVFVVDGMEGSGKSVFAMQCAFYCDPTFVLDRVTFTPKQFRKAIVGAEPYQSVLYDEAYTGLSSRAAMSLINRTLISMLAEIRQKNLFVFVSMPTFFDLDKYVALWRSRALLHVYTTEKFQRGFFAFYNINRKKQLYIKGKKFYSYSQAKPNFIGKFTNHYTINEQEYRKMKKESLLVREKKIEEAEVRREFEDRLFGRLMELGDLITHDQRIEILGISRPTFYRKLKKWNEDKI